MNLLIKNDGGRITIQIVDDQQKPVDGTSLRGWNLASGSNALLLEVKHVG